MHTFIPYCDSSLTYPPKMPLGTIRGSDFLSLFVFGVLDMDFDFANLVL